MEGPILVVDRAGVIWIFSTLAAASSWMEAIDVRDAEYRVHGVSGLEYIPSALTDESPVTIATAKTPPDLELVRGLTSRFLSEIPRAKQRHPRTELRTAEDLRASLMPYISK